MNRASEYKSAFASKLILIVAVFLWIAPAEAQFKTAANMTASSCNGTFIPIEATKEDLQSGLILAFYYSGSALICVARNTSYGSSSFKVLRDNNLLASIRQSECFATTLKIGNAATTGRLDLQLSSCDPKATSGTGSGSKNICGPGGAGAFIFYLCLK